MTKQTRRDWWWVVLMAAAVAWVGCCVFSFRDGHAAAPFVRVSKPNTDGNVRLPNGVWVNPSLHQCNYGTPFAVSSTVPCRSDVYPFGTSQNW